MVHHLIIDRSKWRTGDQSVNQTGVGLTQLLNHDGYMCCLGFFCLAAGLKKEMILGSGQPSDAYFDSKVDLFPVAETGHEQYQETQFSQQAIRINDNPGISSREREEKIKKHFAEASITVEFINNY